MWQAADDDTDLRRFEEQARKQLFVWVISLDQHLSHIDIFCALDAARQEIALLPKEGNRKLVAVSDFLEDDGAYRFISNRSLASPARAREPAKHLHELHGFTMQGVLLCRGRLESSEFARSRRNAKRRSKRSGRCTSPRHVK